MFAVPNEKRTASKVTNSSLFNVLPTGTGFSDVFGFDLPVNEVPRSISVITKEELRNANVVTARDFARVSADTYTPYFNGNPSSTYIRGQVADTFFNGMRIGFTSEGVGAPIDFNAVERVNIVKGPAPAVYGASQNVGGFIDLITKLGHTSDEAAAKNPKHNSQQGGENRGRSYVGPDNRLGDWQYVEHWFRLPLPKRLLGHGYRTQLQ
jgi:outer membrane receptor protein involved in Fe transport